MPMPLSHGYNFVNAGLNGGTGTNYPVQTVDWFDCVKWCNARSQQAGLTPCYYTDAGFTQVFTNGDDGTTVYQNLTVNGYRLPTEAEWEKAARGGGIGLRFPWGNLIHTNQAQYYACTSCYSYDLGPNNSPSGPSPVGSFDVNGYGLYDMAGNVFEWCWDWYGTPYGQPTTTNPTARDRGASVCCAAAIGSTTPGTRGAPSAASATRLRRLRYWVSLCEGALVFALLLFNPFELVSVSLCRDGGQADRKQSPHSGGSFRREMSWRKATTF